jgi:lysozyme
MRLGAKGEALIKSFETLALEAYLPTGKDKWTIGWGHTGPEVHPGLVWTPEQAEAAFLSDVAKAVLAVTRSTDVVLSQNQFDALVSFTFNVGVDAEEHSTLCKLVNARQWLQAADEFGRWNHQAGVVLAGLTRRRSAERALFVLPDRAAGSAFMGA